MLLLPFFFSSFARVRLLQRHLIFHTANCNTTHPLNRYKEAALYLARFRQCQNKAMALVKIHVVNTLRAATQHVVTQVQVGGLGTPAAASMSLHFLQGIILPFLVLCLHTRFTAFFRAGVHCRSLWPTPSAHRVARVLPRTHHSRCFMASFVCTRLESRC